MLHDFPEATPFGKRQLQRLHEASTFTCRRCSCSMVSCSCALSCAHCSRSFSNVCRHCAAASVCALSSVSRAWLCSCRALRLSTCSSSTALFTFRPLHRRVTVWSLCRSTSVSPSQASPSSPSHPLRRLTIERDRDSGVPEGTRSRAASASLARVSAASFAAVSSCRCCRLATCRRASCSLARSSASPSSAASSARPLGGDERGWPLTGDRAASA
mmetsp:Transcript_1127/g.1912  ORF Transcript_1127/g.1912 Transcript_1127/m.1912 type:complete len:215 (-) Transcript_1127:147-791(-)